MRTSKKPATLRTLERAVARKPHTRYVLRLYVTGMTPHSSKAVENIRAICEEYLAGRYDLEIIDIYQHPVLMQGEQIIAAPTLIKTLHEPAKARGRHVGPGAGALGS